MTSADLSDGKKTRFAQLALHIAHHFWSLIEEPTSLAAYAGTNIVGPPNSTRGNDIKSMSVDELWKLHEEVTVELAQKLQSEKTGLTQQLRQFHGADNVSRPYRPRRPSRR